MSLAISMIALISILSTTDAHFDNFTFSTIWTNGVLGYEYFTDTNVTLTATHDLQLVSGHALNPIYFGQNQALSILPSISPHIPTHTQPTSNSSSSINPRISPKQSISSSTSISATQPPYLAHLKTPTQAPFNTSHISPTQHSSNTPSISATQSSYNVSL
eukprot:62111_1